MSTRTFFTFPDGAFSYDCRGCGACCKGLGIGFDAQRGELDRLLGLYPGLGAFARQRGGVWTAINPRGACWFLGDEGLCRVEVAHGREAKPAACRLFPFNRVFLVGDIRVVDFNSVICPLSAPEQGEEELGPAGRIAHAELLDEIARIEEPAMVASPLPIGDNEAARRYIDAEEAIAARCFEAASSPEPHVALGGLWPDTLGSAWAAVFGVARRDPSPEMSRRALLLTPSMRFNERFGPRAYCTPEALSRLLVPMWWAWIGFLAEGEVLAGRPLTLQEATSLWGAQMPLAYLLARWADAPIMDAGPIEIAADGAQGQRLLAIARACHRNGRARQGLGAVLRPVLDPLAPHQRVATMRGLEALLGRIKWGARRSKGRR